ncbi:MAG: di-trans,poly-cis-decaprenylcistransferase, partial [Firmicutes bacterium]|nr:di-trans,poly-cis-decaprenylcistransferase [Bacillota bacterium]
MNDFEKKYSVDISKLDMSRLPSHIAIIMDGNGRWATNKNRPREWGHKRGAEVLEAVSDFADKLGIKHMTVYAFSTENWKRSEKEITAIMNILRFYLKLYISKKGTRTLKLRAIGDITALSPDIQSMIAELTELTSNRTGMTLNIALNYGGRDEILRAVKNIIKNNIDPEDITEENFREFLDTNYLPDPELIIRTGGDERISNFLLWELAYSEFCFMDTFWPDFTNQDL